MLDEFDVKAIYIDGTNEKMEKLKEFKNVIVNTEYLVYWNENKYYQKEVHLTGRLFHPYTDSYISCDVKDIQSYIFVNDEFIRKDKIHSTLNEQGYYDLDIKFKITDLVDETSSKDSTISIYSVLIDEFDRTYVVSYNEYLYSPNVNKFNESYSSNYEPGKFNISFNYQDYE